MDQKTVVFNDIKFRLKEPNPVAFAAWQTQLATAMASDKTDKLTEAYKTMLSWLQIEMLGVWTDAWDSKKEAFGNETLNKPKVTMQLISVVMTEFIQPFFE